MLFQKLRTLGKLLKNLRKLPRIERKLDALARQVEQARPFNKLQRSLQKIGWTNSSIAGRPVDGRGNPIPWYTYPCISFLSDRINGDLKVFEYGSGNSTLWWADRVQSVTSVEHDQAFAEEISKQAPANVKYLFRTVEDGAYARAALDEAEKFHIIIIDGAVRHDCAKVAQAALSDDGIIVYDNTDGLKYREGHQILMSQGFKRIDFHGFGPIWSREWSTGIFYRDGNCLGL